MSSVSPGNPADGLTLEVGQAHNWLQRGLGWGSAGTPSRLREHFPGALESGVH